MKILVFDNYDSFTFNLVHIIRELGFGTELEVHRNDKISIAEVEKFDKILLSPGPGIPSEACILLELIKTYAGKKSILGVCLGHQAIAEAFGGKIYNMPEVLHGVSERLEVMDKDEVLFKGLPTSFLACRYHSWSVEPESLPEQLVVTAIDEKQRIMALRHKQFDVRGVQFHPESIMTEFGKDIMLNWLKN
jgi:anthranilate synthase component II